MTQPRPYCMGRSIAGRAATLAALLVVIGSPATLEANDWPNFLGPDHDGVSRETGLLNDWSETGPLRVWRREVGAGFSSFAIVGDRLYTCGSEEKQQVLFCLDAERGEVIWKVPFEPEFTDPDTNLYGTRSTPTVDEGRVFILGGHALLLCVDAATGKEVWRQTLNNKPHWGYSGSVLIDGPRAIVLAGGSDGSICAFDKAQGKVIWKCGDAPAGYATPRAFTFNGRRYVCALLGNCILAAEMESGREVLRIEWPSHEGVNASTPIVHDGCLFVSTGYGYGAGLFRLSADGDRLKAEPIWKSTKIRNKFQTPILHEGRLFTSDEDALKCVDFATGKRLWRQSGIKHGGLTMADGRLILLTETGELKSAPPSAAEFKPSATAKLFEGSSYSVLRRKQGARCWTAPVVCNGRLYVRDHDTVECLELRRPVGTAGTKK